MIGTIINDRYSIQSEIGRGGMGTVYQADAARQALGNALSRLADPVLVLERCRY